MSRKKRLFLISILIVSAMLIIPLVTVNTVKADAGMLVSILLFFIVYPILSAVVGVLAGKDVKMFWFSPFLVAVSFWLFSSFTYQTAFPVVYSMVYLVICAISMLITWIVSKKP